MTGPGEEGPCPIPTWLPPPPAQDSDLTALTSLAIRNPSPLGPLTAGGDETIHSASQLSPSWLSLDTGAPDTAGGSQARALSLERDTPAQFSKRRKTEIIRAVTSRVSQFSSKFWSRVLK